MKITAILAVTFCAVASAQYTELRSEYAITDQSQSAFEVKYFKFNVADNIPSGAEGLDLVVKVLPMDHFSDPDVYITKVRT